jgi:hypothetical protein
MSDGVTLRVNVFRPDHVAPVVMSMTPYGKDNTPDRIGMLAVRIRTSCWPLVRWIATSWGPVDGIAIIRAHSRDQAEAIAANEPLHKAGWRINTVRLWELNMGALAPAARAACEVATS